MKQARNFSALPKNANLTLTIRTPYQTLFDNFSDFTRLYVGTIKGQIGISNKTIPRVYLLPPGQISVSAMAATGEGKLTNSESGDFIHTGGWCFVHDNNSCEVNLLECTEKERFLWENLEKSTDTETQSPVGRIASEL